MISRDAEVLDRKDEKRQKLADLETKITALLDTHKATKAEGTFRNLRLRKNTFSFYGITGSTKFKSLDGTDDYAHNSTIGAAAVHAGLLKPGQFGILKITHFSYTSNKAIPIKGSTRNGLTSGDQRFGQSSAYRMELLEAAEPQAI